MYRIITILLMFEGVKERDKCKLYNVVMYNKSSNLHIKKTNLLGKLYPSFCSLVLFGFVSPFYSSSCLI